MEEQRISRMYLNLLTRWFSSTFERLFHRGLTRSPLFFVGGLAALVLVPIAAWYLHINGKFHTAKNDLGVTQAAGPNVPRPGGVEAMTLKRAVTVGSSAPEFLTTTLLPGLGMGVLQITAFVPGRGEVPLLAAPSVEALADNDAPARNGTMDDHGSLELPWAGTISGIISPLGATLTTQWRGKTVSVARDPQERTGLAEGGMLATQSADAMQVTSNGNGSTATASFNATDFSGHWPGKTDISVMAQLGPRTLELTVRAKNVGDEPEPLGIGWQPRFVIPAGDRDTLELRLPNGEQMVIVDRARALPSGKLQPAGESLSRFQTHGSTLGSVGIDETLAHLKPSLMDNGAAAEIRDGAGGYGLRLVSVSPSIQALHVIAPSSGGYVSLGMQTNYEDALGKEWNGDGIATLGAGETVEWKVRLEIFGIPKR